MVRTVSGLCLALVLAAAPARGDGGIVQMRRTDGALTVTVFTAPTPLRAGTADISVMVESRASNQPLLDAVVRLELSPRGARQPTVRALATRAQATNKLLYAAAVDVPSPGTWDLSVAVQRENDIARVEGPLIVAAGVPPLVAQWPALAFPPVAVLVFAVHQWLRMRRPPGAA